MGSNGNYNLSQYPKPLQETLEEAIAFQQNMYELSGDWSYYEEKEHEYLKQNIKYAIYGAPDVEKASEDSMENSKEDKSKPEPKPELELEELDGDRKNIIDFIYKKILEASRTKKSLYVGIIFNVLCNVGKEGEKYVSPMPVFKVKRCMEKDEKSSKKSPVTQMKKIGYTALYKCCVYYVDMEGRIYRNWTDYVINNMLPKSTMVLPMGGFYQANPNADNTAEKTHVWVEIASPSIAKKILPILDIAGTVLGVGALGVGAVALAAPAALAAPIGVFVAGAGTVCGGVSGVWVTGRSGQQLVDRRKHQQSISVKDRSARSAWLGFVGGLAGGMASGSTILLNKAVQAGVQVGNIGRGTYNTIAIGNIVVNGMGIGNGVYGIYETYRERKEFSVLEIGQVVAHILFFGNAVMNFQTARTIIDNTQRQVLQDYESSLRSNRHKKAFRRIKRNTEAASGDRTTADSEIIRGIRSIQNKDDFFAGVVRNRKVFSASKAEVTFKDGYAMINDNVRFDPMELSQQPMEVRSNTVGAAEPFARVTRSTLPQTNKMLAAAFMQQTSITTEMLKVILASSQVLVPKIPYVGRLILDMQSFLEDDRYTLIGNLTRFVLHLIKENRDFVTRSFEDIIEFGWFRYVRPKLVAILQDMGIDASLMTKIPAVAELVFSVALQLINEMYDSVEDFLECIIKHFEKTAIESEPIVCSTCSGHFLEDL